MAACKTIDQQKLATSRYAVAASQPTASAVRQLRFTTVSGVHTTRLKTHSQEASLVPGCICQWGRYGFVTCSGSDLANVPLCQYVLPSRQ